MDAKDKSSCTPLWYSLAFRFWKLAEYLIVNGAKGLPKRLYFTLAKNIETIYVTSPIKSVFGWVGQFDIIF